MKGYRFETRVRKALQKVGYLVIRQHKSAFPDLICIQDTTRATVMDDLQDDLSGPTFIECKVGGWLSPEERERFKPYEKHGNTIMARPDKATDGTNVIVFLEAQTKKEIARVRG
jgi:hypothetical protein